MVALSIAMCLLFEVAVQVTRVHDRRKAARELGSEEDYSQLSDDDVSPLNMDTKPEQPSEKPATSSFDDVT